MVISIHTTAKVVTDTGYKNAGGKDISIHTTAKVVTKIADDAHLDELISIHTTAKVVTFPLDRNTTLLYDFNPHHREGGDFPKVLYLSNVNDFNPHHREGGDIQGIETGVGAYISIHTTAKVVTQTLHLTADDNSVISIHTTAKVVTRNTDNGCKKYGFQSTPPRRW